MTNSKKLIAMIVAVLLAASYSARAAEEKPAADKQTAERTSVAAVKKTTVKPHFHPRDAKGTSGPSESAGMSEKQDKPLHDHNKVHKQM